MKVKNNLMSMIHLLIIVGLFGTQYPVNGQFNIIVTFSTFALTSYQTMDGIHDTILKFETASTDDIIDKVADLSASVDMWGNKIENKLDEIDAFLRRLNLLEGITDDIQVLTAYFTRIDTLYDEFKEYVANPKKFNNATIADLLEIFTSRKDGDLVDTITKLHALIVPGKLDNYKKSVLLLLAQETQEHALEICDLGVPQYRLYDLYSIIATIEMRAMTMTNSGYVMKSLQKNTSYMGEIEWAGNRFLKRMQSYLVLLRNAMEIASKEFRRCDPPEGYIRKKSFYEFERFLQAVVLNQEVLHPHYLCFFSCPTGSQPYPMRECSAASKKMGACSNSEPECRGRLSHCNSLNGEAYWCEIEGNGPRRLQWVRDGSGTLSGDGSADCDNDVRYNRKNGADFIHVCDICQCICADEDVAATSTHFINLREQLSDVANNKVIVGLQLSINNNIAQFEVLQGLLGPNGTINENAIEWIDLENIHYHRRKSIESKSFKFYKHNEDDDSQEEMIEDKDIAVLNYDFRRINLDKLTVPSKHLVTGIKFVREVTATSGDSLHLEIQATPFDYESGKLDTEKSVWVGPEDTSYVKNGEIRTEYKGEGFRNPEKSQKTKIDTKPNTFIDFKWSDWKEDASQTVIPLLDAIPVYADPIIPLTGVGLYHKKQRGYGGFLTLVLEGFDRSFYIVDKVDDKKPKNGKRQRKGRECS